MTQSSSCALAPGTSQATIVVAGTGWAVPDTQVDNHHLAGVLDTSDDWITTRTGIRSRRIAGTAESTATLATQAARSALCDAGISADEIDLVIVATCTDEAPMPSTAAFVAAALGCTAGGFDLDAACAGFAYALTVAAGLLQARAARQVLLIGADTMSRVVDPTDRSTAVLFGDGAAALVLRAGGTATSGLLGVDAAGDGTGIDLLGIVAGGSRVPASVATVRAGDHYVHMSGRELFRRVVRDVSASVERTLAASGFTVADIDWFVPHQANARIVDAVLARTGLDVDRVLGNGDRFGNTSAASIPLSLACAAHEGRLRSGDRLLLSGFGAGLSVATVLWGWEAG